MISRDVHHGSVAVAVNASRKFVLLQVTDLDWQARAVLTIEQARAVIAELQRVVATLESGESEC